MARSRVRTGIEQLISSRYAILRGERVGIITNPDSTLSVGLSLAPVFGPVTMYVRTLVSDPPVWHILLSIVVSILTIAAMFWATAKIFRVGILSYGKRPPIPEMWRWLKVA